MAGAGSLTRGKVKHALKSQGSSEMNVLYIYIGTALTPCPPRGHSSGQ